MPIFESQRLIVEELYGIECSDLIDYDQFRIPFQGTFDLIVANHMLTHIVRLDRFFSELRAHLRPGGISICITSSTKRSSSRRASRSSTR